MLTCCLPGRVILSDTVDSSEQNTCRTIGKEFHKLQRFLILLVLNRATYTATPLASCLGGSIKYFLKGYKEEIQTWVL